MSCLLLLLLCCAVLLTSLTFAPTPSQTLFQSLLEELSAQEQQLSRLRERAQQVWDEHSAGKGYLHRVSQLSAQLLALTNTTKVTRFAGHLDGGSRLTLL